MQYVNNVTIGSDPELFIVNTKTGRIVSSIGLIPGVKGRAYRPEGFDKGFGIQIDNILAEFNIPPVRDEESFIAAMNHMKEYIRDFVKQKNPDLDILCRASALIDADQLSSPEAKLFGCCPDFNAYTQSRNEAPKGNSTNLRTTGCHIHCGYDNPTIPTSIALIKYMDFYLGVPSVLIDKDNRRRTLYGKAGCFRLTDYGFEYRVLSGYFISSDSLMSWMYNQTMEAIKAYNSDIDNYARDLEEYDTSECLPDPDLIQKIINTGNAKMAKEMVEDCDIQLIH